MKRFLLIASIVLTFTACNRCQDCTCNTYSYNQYYQYTEEVCRNDFDSNADYNEAIAALEIIGCNCN